MSNMQNFVNRQNGRTGSPQDGQQPKNPQRQLTAANAKVQMKPSVARPPTAQGLSVGAASIAQHQSAPLQHQHLQRRPSAEGRKRDLYDTDASSLESTTNYSVVHLENSPQALQQQVDPDVEESETGDDDVFGEEEYDGEGGSNLEQYQDYFAKHNVRYEDRLWFLKETQPQLFDDSPQLLPTIDGDSYPTTTDGNPTEREEQQEEHLEGPVRSSPSPQRFPPGQSTSLFNQQPVQQRLVPVTLFSKSKQIRGQQRTEGAAHTRGQSVQQNDAAYLPTSQPPTYSQANPEPGLAAPPVTQAHQEVTVQPGRADQPRWVPRLPPGPGHIHNYVPRINEPVAHPTHATAVRTMAIPIVQQHVDTAPVEEVAAEPVGDYNPDVLFDMDYEQLRGEDFDKNPRAGEPVLSKDMLEKPLEERLKYAHQKLDAATRFEFFNALPTNEWEDAGDWFLDRFSEIIRKTKDARQKKRKMAQDIEQEIEMRHKHVAKKQRLVEDAMAKMKTKGEGLVPKSPRASKSPLTKRR